MHPYNSNNIFIRRPETDATRKSFGYRGAVLWNGLPSEIKIQPSTISYPYSSSFFVSPCWPKILKAVGTRLSRSRYVTLPWLQNFSMTTKWKFTKKVNSHCFKLHRYYSVSFNLSNVGEIFWIESERSVSEFRKRKRNFLCFVQQPFLLAFRRQLSLRSMVAK